MIKRMPRHEVRKQGRAQLPTAAQESKISLHMPGATIAERVAEAGPANQPSPGAPDLTPVMPEVNPEEVLKTADVTETVESPKRLWFSGVIVDIKPNEIRVYNSPTKPAGAESSRSGGMSILYTQQGEAFFVAFGKIKNANVEERSDVKEATAVEEASSTTDNTATGAGSAVSTDETEA